LNVRLPRLGRSAVNNQESAVTTNADEVRRFLTIVSEQAQRAFEGIEHPGLLQLTTLHPASDKLVPARYTLNDVDGMTKDAIAASDAGCNVYIEARTVRAGLRGKTRGKLLEDTVGVFGLVVDSDADKGMSWTPTVDAPLAVETSPGNAHYWFFVEKALAAADAKALGERMRAAANADHDTGNPSQPYRIAGTTNYPSIKKQKRGRVITPTRIISLSASRPDIEATFPELEAKTNGKEHDPNPDGAGDIPPELMTLIRDGVAEGNRSDQFFAAVAKLKRLGWTVDGITHLLEQHPAGIASKYQGRVREQVTDCFAKVEEQTRQDNETKLAQLNARYAVVLDGGKARVLTFEKHTRIVKDKTYVRDIPMFLGFEDFKNIHMNKLVQRGDKVVPLGRWWLEHPKRNQYDGVTFQPGGEKVIDGRRNLWRGWGIMPKEGDWSLMEKHIREVLAADDDATSKYILDWLAWTVQHPAEQAGATPVFRGKLGCGKGTLGTALCRMFGQHAIHISDAGHLSGRFNAHLRDCCFLFADEAYWPGDRSAEGTLKRLITEPTLQIEAKGRDSVNVPNMLHIMMASNEAWIVPAGEHERRFACFNVSNHRMQEKEWFEPLYAQLEDGGYAAMLWDLLYRDLGSFHPRDIPRTSALLEQQHHSLNPLDAWWIELLETGTLEGADPAEPNRAVSNEYQRELTEDTDIGTKRVRYVRQRGIYDQARALEPRLKGRSDHILGHFLTEQGCDNTHKVLRKRGWTFPELAACRAKWNARFPQWSWRDPTLDRWQAPEED
jgi:hypothetical protein